MADVSNNNHYYADKIESSEDEIIYQTIIERPYDVKKDFYYNTDKIVIELKIKDFKIDDYIVGVYINNKVVYPKFIYLKYTKPILFIEIDNIIDYLGYGKANAEIRIIKKSLIINNSIKDKKCTLHNIENYINSTKNKPKPTLSRVETICAPMKDLVFVSSKLNYYSTNSKKFYEKEQDSTLKETFTVHEKDISRSETSNIHKFKTNIKQ